MLKGESVSNNEGYFSNFGHFRAPIKRPSCNPIVKDERFRHLNSENVYQHRYQNGYVPCDSQVDNNPYYRSACSPDPVITT